MVAPTPVRSLVHSRTLVVSGCFLIYIYLLKYNFFLCDWIILIGLLRIFLSSFLSFFELDLKKVIAWRTLSQVGLIFFIFSFGLYFCSFIYLIRHAFFKSCLFLVVGIKIFYESGNQDYRFLNSLNFNFIFCIFLFCIISLISFIFSGGIIVKDYILDLFLNYNIFYFIFFLCIYIFLITNIYSFKLIFIFFNINFVKSFFLSFFGILSLLFLGLFIYFCIDFFFLNFFFLNYYFIEDFYFYLFFFLFFIFFYLSFILYLLRRKFLGNYFFLLFSNFFINFFVDYLLLLIILLFNFFYCLRKIFVKLFKFNKYFFYLFILIIFI